MLTPVYNTHMGFSLFILILILVNVQLLRTIIKNRLLRVKKEYFETLMYTIVIYTSALRSTNTYHPYSMKS